MLLLTLPGVTVTYQGEEIGMTNNMDIPYEDGQDPRGCACGPDRFLEPDCSRDPERTPMQWTDVDNAGFSDPGVETWLPVNSDYTTINVEQQNGDPSSHLAIYTAMTVRKRDEPILRVSSNT